MAIVAAEGVVKTYGEGRAARRVLDGADLTVEAGEIVAILGRSGSGKSTLLHLIGGLDRADAGTITVAGEPVTGAGEKELSSLRRRRIGFVFQFFHLLPELSGEANVLLAGRVRRRDVSKETIYCAELLAATYQHMGVLPKRRPPSWYDPGKFWSGDQIEMAEGYSLGEEIAIR